MNSSSLILEKINKLSSSKFYILFTVIVFLPIFLFGTFIQDDNTIINLSKLNFINAVENICYVNHNRPLSCLYHGLLSRFLPIYQIYFLIDLILFFFSIIFVIKSFNFLFVSEKDKKLFFSLAIIPFFSYTVIYSPGMQSMGTLALFFWSVSLLFLKIFIERKRKLNLFYSYLFIFTSLLIYESPFPLISILIFFPLFFANKKLTKFSLFNFAIHTFILLFVLFLQKKVFINFYGLELSRFKLGFNDIGTIFYLLFINLVLIINIFFQSIEIFVYGAISTIKNLNFLLFLHISLVLFFIFSNTNKVFSKITFIKSKNENLYKFLFIFMLLGVLVLAAFMHAAANTGIDFIKYNNRALVSISLVFSLFLFFLIKYLSNDKIFNFIRYVFLFLVFIFTSNFLFFQNNMIYKNFHGTEIHRNILRAAYEVEKENSLKDNLKGESSKVFFIIREQMDKAQRILEYGSSDKLGFINKSKVERPHFIFLTDRKVCNKNYFNPYIKIYFDNRDFRNYLFVINNKNNYVIEKLYFDKYKPEEREQYFNEYYDCLGNNYQKVSNRVKFISKDESSFMIYLVKLYNYLNND